MGKYDKLRDELPSGADYYHQKIQIAIANELAEASRLKRIEIKHQYFSTKLDHSGLSYDEEGLDKLLEDQA